MCRKTLLWPLSILEEPPVNNKFNISIVTVLILKENSIPVLESQHTAFHDTSSWNSCLCKETVYLHLSGCLSIPLILAWNSFCKRIKLRSRIISQWSMYDHLGECSPERDCCDSDWCFINQCGSHHHSQSKLCVISLVFGQWAFTNRPCQGLTHPDDHTQPTCDIQWWQPSAGQPSLGKRSFHNWNLACLQTSHLGTSKFIISSFKEMSIWAEVLILTFRRIAHVDFKAQATKRFLEFFLVTT